MIIGVFLKKIKIRCNNCNRTKFILNDIQAAEEKLELVVSDNLVPRKEYYVAPNVCKYCYSSLFHIDLEEFEEKKIRLVELELLLVELLQDNVSREKIYRIYEYMLKVSNIDIESTTEYIYRLMNRLSY